MFQEILMSIWKYPPAMYAILTICLLFAIRLYSRSVNDSVNDSISKEIKEQNTNDIEGNKIDALFICELFVASFISGIIISYFWTNDNNNGSTNDFVKNTNAQKIENRQAFL